MKIKEGDMSGRSLDEDSGRGSSSTRIKPESCIALPLISGAFCLLCSTQACAADGAQATALPAVTVTVDRLQMQRDESPSNISIVDRNDFEKLPVRDAFDALSLMPNVNVRRAGSVFGEGSITMYGLSGQPFAPTNNVIAINGVPLNSGLLPEISLNFVPLILINRFELIQGPGSSAYGSNATTGVLNLVTRRAERPAQGGADLTVASRWDTAYGSGYVGSGAAGDYSIVAGVYGGDTDGHLQPSGRTDFSDASKRNAAVLGEKTFGATRVFSALLYQGIEEHNPDVRGPLRATFNDSERTHFHLGARHTVTPQVDVEAIYTYNDFSGSSVETFNTQTIGFGTNASRPPDPSDQSTRSNGLMGRVIWNAGSNSLTAGAEFQDARLEDLIVRRSYSGNTRGFFLQDHYLAFDDQLSLQAGYRYDKASTYSDPSHSPRLGAVWRPKGENWLIRANLSKAFNAPTFNQLFSAGFVRGNPNLVAQTVVLRELGGEVTPLPGLRLGASVFRATLDNPIFPRFNAAINATQFTNVSSGSDNNGATLTGEFRTGNWLMGGSYTYLDPGNATFHNWRHSGKLYGYYRGAGWTIGGDVLAASEGYWADDFLRPAENYAVINLRATYDVTRGVRLVAGVENLTNESYATTASIGNVAGVPNNTGIPRPGRFFTAGVELSF